MACCDRRDDGAFAQAPRMNVRFARNLLLAALALAACVSSHPIATNVAASPVARGPVFSDMGAAPALDLEDAVALTPLSPQLSDKVVLLSFVTTTCKESCPVVEAKFTAVQQKLARDGYLGSRVHLVLVGMDPVEDTPKSLAALAKRTQARRGAFHFATGTAREIARVLHDYGIAIVYNGGSHIDPDHTVAIYLIDPDRRIRYDFAMFYPAAEMGRISEQLADETTRR
jgi:cytochrome oxidase Cu insertion factor (SCO1/SenC/PrrC family)